MHHPFILKQPDVIAPPPQLLKTDPVTYLKSLISLQSTRTDTTSTIAYTITHTLLILQSTPPDLLNQRALISQLFYTYLFLIPKYNEKDEKPLAEILLIVNYLWKDLESVNDYTRIRATRCVSSFVHRPLSKIINNFITPLFHNLEHKNEYIRITSLSVLYEMYLKGMCDTFIDVLRKHLCDFSIMPIFKKEVLQKIFFIDGDFSSVFSKDSDSEYKALIDKMPGEVLDVIVRLCSHLKFIYSANNKSPYFSSLKILKRLSLENIDINKDMVITNLFTCQRSKDALFEVILQNIPPHVFAGHTKEMIDIVLSQNNIENDTIDLEILYDFLMATCVTAEDSNIISHSLYDILVGSVPTIQIKTLKIIKNHVEASSNHLIINQVREMINSNDPSLSNECLDFLEHVPGLFVDLGTILYGKILRKAISIVGNKISDQNGMIRYLIVFEDALNKAENYVVNNDEKERKPILNNLSSPSSPFIGNYIALFFEKTARRIFLDGETCARMIALLLRFIVQGENTGKMDRSSYQTIIMCIESIYRGYIENLNQGNKIINTTTKTSIKEIDLVHKKDDTSNMEQIYKKGSVLDLPVFSFIGTRKKTRTMFKKEIKSPEKLYQLTGISDPIFVEAKVNIKISGLEVDLVLINQTKSMLQNINIEFTTSQNIKKSNYEDQNHISVMKTGEVKNIVLDFEVDECSNGFLCGAISFNFPGDRGQYSGSIYEMFLGEIQFEIKDFLAIPKIWKDEEFREKWKILEWENTYSLKKKVNKEKYTSNDKNNEGKLFKIRNSITDALNATLVAEHGDSGFLVFNMVCETMLGDKILINAILVIDDSFSIECRIRSTAENMVKSISNIISDSVKNIPI